MALLASSLGIEDFMRGKRQTQNPFSSKKNPVEFDDWNTGWLRAFREVSNSDSMADTLSDNLFKANK